ncbi:MAG: hypothetical protein MH137_01555 [Flavobacteriales bacterium]|nr:hypothetical protein [Flavobacteriales bacterium]
MTTYIIISIVIITVLFFLLRKNNNNTQINTKSASSLVKNPNSTPFSLCSKNSISVAFKNIDMLTKNNERDERLYKSFQSLKCSKNDLKKSFYFLKDCIYFCKNEPIYNNMELLANLNFLETQVNLYYLDTASEEIPHDEIENYEFGKKFNLDKGIENKELEDLKLIYWRGKEHWEFWVDKYGINNDLGKYCISQARK